MTTVAGFDFNREFNQLAVQVGWPQLDLHQGGNIVTGHGIIDGDTATYLPPNTNVRPLPGDLVRLRNGELRQVDEVTGLEDAWTLGLATTPVPQLPDDEFDLRVELLTGYGFALIRMDPGAANVKGRWRVNQGAWNTFVFEGRTHTIRSQPGAIEIDAWRVSEDGEGSEPVHRTVELTSG